MAEITKYMGQCRPGDEQPVVIEEHNNSRYLDQRCIEIISPLTSNIIISTYISLVFHVILQTRQLQANYEKNIHFFFIQHKIKKVK